MRAVLALLWLLGCGPHARPEPRAPVLRGSGPSLTIAVASRLPWPRRIVDVTAAVDGRPVLRRARPTEVARVVVERGARLLTLEIRVTHPCQPGGTEVATVHQDFQVELEAEPAAVLVIVEGAVSAHVLALRAVEHGTVTDAERRAAAMREVRTFGPIPPTPLDCSAYVYPDSISCRVEAMLRAEWGHRDVERAACLIAAVRRVRAAAAMPPEARIPELRILEVAANRCVWRGCEPFGVPHAIYPDCDTNELWPAMRESPFEGAPPIAVPPISRI